MTFPGHSALSRQQPLSRASPLAARCNWPPAKIADTAKGKALVDGKGHDPLHLRQGTPAGSGCATAPARTTGRRSMASAGAKTYRVTGRWSRRDDGELMWAYKGKPLYASGKGQRPPGEHNWRRLPQRRVALWLAP